MNMRYSLHAKFALKMVKTKLGNMKPAVPSACTERAFGTYGLTYDPASDH
jgi:hypothetical protein